MGAAKEKIVTILESYEDSLSDGFGYYADDVQATLLTIADEIIAALDTKEQNGSSPNSAMVPCPVCSRCANQCKTSGVIITCESFARAAQHHS